MSEPEQPKPRYEPPRVEDVPVNPEERLLFSCKASGDYNPVCFDQCDACSSPGS